MNDDVTVYMVANLAAATEKFEKLARRAKKIGVPAPTFTKVGEHNQVEVVSHDAYGKAYFSWVRKDDTAHSMNLTGRARVCHHLVINGDHIVKLNGWTFIASLDHELGADNTIVSVVPGCEGLVPEGFRHRGTVCDHCKENRTRKMTYVVRHENGDIKQVGSTCLRDFLGSDARNALCSVDLMVLASECLEEDKEEYPHGSEVYDLEHFLSYVAMDIRENGWRSRTDYPDGMATADRARNMILDSIEDAGR